MQVEAVGRPIKYTLKTGETYRLKPGFPVELPDGVAQQLLKKAGDKVRVVPSDITIQPAPPSARPVFWERAGRIIGPATPEFLAQTGLGTKDFWVVALHDSLPVWIFSQALRSRQAFETQPPVQILERIREPR